jgi:kynurenine formamidase
MFLESPRRAGLGWRTGAAVFCFSVSLPTCVPANAPPIAGLNGVHHVADLTHTLSPEFPFIPVQNKTFPFRMSAIATVAADGVYANRWELTEHVGTHLDAPSHFHEGGLSIDELPLANLFAPLVVIDISDRARREADTTVSKGDVLGWEREHGPIPRGAAVFVRTGWDARAKDAPTFVNLDAQGVMHFPGFGVAAIDWLVAERDIAGVGIDTLSIDPGPDTAYPVHKRLFASGKWAVECLANLATIPASGASVLVAPVKVRHASGAPARVVALW